MLNILGVILVYIVFRVIEVVINIDEENNKKNKNKKMTFGELAKKLQDEFEKSINEQNEVINAKKTMQKQKTRKKLIENSPEPLVSSDKNLKMRSGEDSLEGMSLENFSKSECLMADKNLQTKKPIELGEKKLENNITNDDLIKGVIFSEILSKPVSLR